jgi:hypothetical protein
MEAALDRGVANGMSLAMRARWRAAMYRYRSFWRTQLGGDPPAQVELISIQLKPGAVPTRALPRTYKPSILEWLRTFMTTLVNLGIFYVVLTSVWASAPHIREKHGAGSTGILNQARMVVDLRRVNDATTPVYSSLPCMETAMSNARHATHFAVFDLQSGFFQIGMTAETSEICTVATPFGLYRPTRMLQGMVNATAHFQAQVRAALGDLYGDICEFWVDDLYVWANGDEDLLDRSIRVWDRLCSRGFKAAAHKAQLYSETLHWCGRYADGDGVWHDPARIQGLVDMRPPQDVGELMQFCCAVNWMRLHLPRLAAVMSPLTALLESKLAGQAKRTKGAASRIGITAPEWASCATAWEDTRALLMQAVKLAHPGTPDAYATCVFPDASEFHWGVAVTQVPHEDMGKPVEEMRHEPLAFLSGSFKASELHWSITDKEAWPLVVVYRRLTYLLHGDVHLFTDHRNLAYVFAPSRDLYEVSKATSQRLARWAVMLGSFPYRIQHIAGERNVWGDLLSRWVQVPAVLRQHVLLHGESAVGLTGPSATLPSVAAIIEAQQLALQDGSPPGVSLERGSDGLHRVLLNGSRRVWIPTTAVALQKRLLVISHCSGTGHRGVDATLATLAAFWWTSLREDARAFVNDCLNCVDGRHGTKIPRPFGETVCATAPCEVLHFDFAHLGQSELGGVTYPYVLVLSDDFTGMVMLEACTAATSEMAARGILSWCSVFGVPKVLVSDTASHFKNEMLGHLRSLLGCDHHFSVANVSFSNGTVERMVQEMIRAFKATLLDRQRPLEEWVEYLSVVQLALNSAVRARLQVSPHELMFGVPPRTAVSAVLASLGEGKWTTQPVELESIQRHCIQLQAAITSLHKRVGPVRRQHRRRGRQQQQKGVLPNFAVGDFVLCARVRKRGATHKLAATWCGPFRITAVGTGHVFQIQHLLSGELSSAHASRLLFYADERLELTTELKDHIALVERQGYFEIERLVAVRQHDGQLEAQVAWAGFSEAEWTWEPLSQLLEDREVFIIRQLRALQLPKSVSLAIQREFGCSL